MIEVTCRGLLALDFYLGSPAEAASLTSCSFCLLHGTFEGLQAGSEWAVNKASALCSQPGSCCQTFLFLSKDSWVIWFSKAVFHVYPGPSCLCGRYFRVNSLGKLCLLAFVSFVTFDINLLTVRIRRLLFISLT